MNLLLVVFHDQPGWYTEILNAYPRNVEQSGGFGLAMLLLIPVLLRIAAEQLTM